MICFRLRAPNPLLVQTANHRRRRLRRSHPPKPIDYNRPFFAAASPPRSMPNRRRRRFNLSLYVIDAVCCARNLSNGGGVFVLQSELLSLQPSSFSTGSLISLSALEAARGLYWQACTALYRPDSSNCGRTDCSAAISALLKARELVFRLQPQVLMQRISRVSRALLCYVARPRSDLHVSLWYD